jgi:hypothetical protein
LAWRERQQARKIERAQLSKKQETKSKKKKRKKGAA